MTPKKKTQHQQHQQQQQHATYTHTHTGTSTNTNGYGQGQGHTPLPKLEWSHLQSPSPQQPKTYRSHPYAPSTHPTDKDHVHPPSDSAHDHARAYPPPSFDRFASPSTAAAVRSTDVTRSSNYLDDSNSGYDTDATEPLQQSSVYFQPLDDTGESITVTPATPYHPSLYQQSTGGPNLRTNASTLSPSSNINHAHPHAYPHSHQPPSGVYYRDEQVPLHVNTAAEWTARLADAANEEKPQTTTTTTTAPPKTRAWPLNSQQLDWLLTEAEQYELTQ